MNSAVYLSLGSNIGDRAGNLNAAIDRLRAVGEIVQVSPFYETEPVEFAAQAWFLNCAIALDTEKTPQELLASILDIEQQMGRRRGQKKGPRVIDIDLIAYGDIALKTERLTLPHPELFNRAFVLVPLAEIAPDLMIAGVGVAKAAERLQDEAAQILPLD